MPPHPSARASARPKGEKWTMPALKEPMELLDLQDGGQVSFQVLKYDTGTTVIKPPDAPQGKEIYVLRVHVRPQDKGAFPHYYDLTSKRLVAQLEPILRAGTYRGKTFTVKKHGVKPVATFELQIR